MIEWGLIYRGLTHVEVDEPHPVCDRNVVFQGSSAIMCDFRFHPPPDVRQRVIWLEHPVLEQLMASSAPSLATPPLGNKQNLQVV